MYKLLKKLPNETHYWEVWKSGRSLHFTYGVLGVSNKSEEQPLSLFERGNKLMKRLVEEKENQGFVQCHEDKEIKVDIAYREDAAEYETFRQASYDLQDKINDSLLSTGIGYTEGITINESGATIYFFVVDEDLGIVAIQKILLEQKLLNESSVSLLQEDGNYISANTYQSKD
ncbi:MULTISPECIES: hypothetical protein [Psychrobacillus]|jgi:predicted DNA-binding WGR domain protein|uniref:WGR domain-containing protein n=2 Tax=Psychrobacillus TaxID=1221880 RepID=A0ABR8RDI8_9BACI|nr:hypothetical protein [Psychrobacillus faecigallinarum]MBD7945794.1 hypothetical protein [Psychrobacillus faecigallinarum]QGM29348.1 hypothetical protein GI482_02600 [Bacillus sp. N3536]